MKLQKQLSKKTEKKNYYKYILNIPEDNIDGAGFKEGDELEAEVKKGEIRLRISGINNRKKTQYKDIN